VTPGGAPIVLDLGDGPRPATRSVIQVVEQLVNETTISVDATVIDAPGDAVDATRFVRAVAALGAEPADGARIVDGRFVDVTPGTRVTYRFTVLNDTVEPGPAPQRFGLRLLLRDARGATLNTREVEIVVPTADGTSGCE